MSTSRPVLEIRLLKNVLIAGLEDENGSLLFAPMTMREAKELTHKRDALTKLGPLVPEFDMSFVHRIPCPDTRPRMPVKKADVPDAFYNRLVENAYSRALEARVAGEALRKTIANLVASGTIEVVADETGFLDAHDDLDEAEVAYVADKRAADEVNGLVSKVQKAKGK